MARDNQDSGLFRSKTPVWLGDQESDPESRPRSRSEDRIREGHQNSGLNV